MKKSIFLFFAAILCATSAWAGPTFSGGYVYFHNKGGWNDSNKQLCIGKVQAAIVATHQPTPWQQ